MLNTKEYYEVMKQFEKTFPNLGLFEKEEKNLWKIKQTYKNGKVNELFNFYLSGYSYGKSEN